MKIFTNLINFKLRILQIAYGCKVIYRPDCKGCLICKWCEARIKADQEIIGSY